MRSTLAIVIAGLAFLGTGWAQELSPIEELGKLLFFDENLSTPPGQSCATCHGPEAGFAGPISEINATTGVYPGAVHVRFGNRKPPAAAYATFSPDFHYDEEEGLYVGGMFWDGRALNVVEQAKGPFLNPLEQNNPNMKSVINKVRHSDYAPLFREVFGPDALDHVPTAYQHVAEAIAAYEGSGEVNRFSSKYDYYLAGLVELTPQELHGLELYEGPGNCAACHPSQPGPNGEPPLFTDYTYDNLGVPRNENNPFYDMPPHFNPDGEDFVDYGLGAVLGLADEMGKMKVPTLRNVGMKPYESFVQAYMHNGVFTSLIDVVDFYNTRDLGGWPAPEVPENVNVDELGDLGLSMADVEDVVAFLNALTDGYVLGPEGRPLAWSPGAGTSALGPIPETRFSLATPEPVTVRIFDAAGRLVRTLLRGEPFAAGLHRYAWDGRDDQGQRLASGVYLHRVTAGTRTEVHRTLLVQ